MTLRQIQTLVDQNQIQSRQERTGQLGGRLLEPKHLRTSCYLLLLLLVGFAVVLVAADLVVAVVVVLAVVVIVVIVAVVIVVDGVDVNAVVNVVVAVDVVFVGCAGIVKKL